MMTMKCPAHPLGRATGRLFNFNVRVCSLPVGTIGCGISLRSRCCKRGCYGVWWTISEPHAQHSKLHLHLQPMYIAAAGRGEPNAIHSHDKGDEGDQRVVLHIIPMSNHMDRR